MHLQVQNKQPLPASGSEAVSTFQSYFNEIGDKVGQFYCDGVEFDQDGDLILVTTTYTYRGLFKVNLANFSVGMK